MAFKYLNYKGSVPRLMDETAATVLAKSPKTKLCAERYYRMQVNELGYRHPGSKEHLEAIERRLLTAFFKKGDTATWYEGMCFIDPEFNGEAAQERGRRILDDLFRFIGTKVAIGER